MRFITKCLLFMGFSVISVSAVAMAFSVFVQNAQGPMVWIPILIFTSGVISIIVATFEDIFTMMDREESTHTLYPDPETDGTPESWYH